MDFSQACRHTIETFAPSYEVDSETRSAEALVSLKGDERIAEAKTVQPCVDAFVAAEVEDRNPGPGRYSKRSHYAKSLGCRYRWRLPIISSDDPVDLLLRVISIGYVSALDAQAQVPIGVSHDRGTEAVWNYSIVRLLSDFAEDCLGRRHVYEARGATADSFRQSLRESGLKRPLRGRLGAQALGQLYARAGLVFRIVHSDQVPEAALTADPMQVTNRWRRPAE